MNNYNISNLLIKLRTDYGFNIQQIADIIGVSKAAVSKWENGDDIKTEHLYDLAKLYNVTLSEICSGKLNNESSKDYLYRNYDLSSFELNEDVINKNVDKLKFLFNQCKIVKNRFFELLPKWSENNLSKDELEEFSIIEKYFKFDLDYCVNKFNQIIILDLNKNVEKELVLRVINKISSFSEDEYMWELTKLYDFIYDYKEEKILSSNNLKALEYMLSFFTQIEKDSTLCANLYTPDGIISDYDIENISFFKIIINSGANVLYSYKPLQSFLDNELFDKIEGKVVEINREIYSKYEYAFYDHNGNKCIPILKNWKSFTYDDYLEFVDTKSTERLKDIVNLKNNNPQKYYSNLIKREQL